MKRTAIALSIALTALTALGQGTLNFNTKTVSALVTVGGTAVTGPSYMGQLYVANPAAGNAFQAVGSPVAFYSGGVGSLKGYITTGGEVAVGFLAGGTSAQVMLKAWNSAAGSSFEAASGSATGIVGSSAPITVTLGNPLAVPPGTPADLTGLAGFAVTAVIPEPSTIALGLLGVAGLLIRRRK